MLLRYDYVKLIELYIIDGGEKDRLLGRDGDSDSIKKQPSLDEDDKKSMGSQDSIHKAPPSSNSTPRKVSISSTDSISEDDPNCPPPYYVVDIPDDKKGLDIEVGLSRAVPDKVFTYIFTVFHVRW